MIISQRTSTTYNKNESELIDLVVISSRERVDDLLVFEYLSLFCFLLIEFHCTFPILIKFYQIVYYNSISIRMWWAVGTSFIRARRTFFPYSRLSSVRLRLSQFILAVPMRECLGKHSCKSSQFPIAILNGTSSFLSLVQETINMPSGHYYRLCSWSGR